MIDQIAVRKAAGFNLITPAEWQALPKEERAGLVRAHHVEFLADGESVPVRAALLELKARAGLVAA